MTAGAHRHGRKRTGGQERRGRTRSLAVKAPKRSTGVESPVE